MSTRWDRAIDRFGPWLVLGVFASAGLCIVADYGVTTDEPWRMLWSRGWWRALQTGEIAQYTQMPEREYYGVLYDLAGRLSWLVLRGWFAGNDEFFGRHLLNFATACVALLGVYRLGEVVVGPSQLGRRIGLLAMLLMATSPRWFGSAFTNPKDIPFTATAIWAAWAAVRLARSGRRNAYVVAAALAGLCSAVRPFGVVFFAIAGTAAFVATPAPRWRRGGLRALGVVGLAFACCLMLWPVLWVRPPWHLVTATIDLTQHVHGSRSLFFGSHYPFWDAPGGYVVGWLAVTLPPVVVVAAPLAIVGLVGWAVRHRPPLRDAFGWALLVAWVVGPALLPVLRRTTLYDTSRHLLFMVPALCILAATACVFVSGRTRALRVVVGLVVGLGVGDSVRSIVALHPYQSLHFNRLVGGLPGAQSRFDIAHYSETYAEGFAWLAANHPGARVHAMGNGSAAASYYAWKLGLRLNTTKFEFFISEVRQGWQATLPGHVVHTISRQGVPLLQIRRVVPMTHATVAYVRPRRAAQTEPPSPPTADDPWTAVTSDDGRFDVNRVLDGEPGYIAIALTSQTSVATTLVLCHYLGLTAWIDGTSVYRRKVVPFQYRGTEDFPSLDPLPVTLPPGHHWLVADLSEARLHWKFGVYAPRSDVAFAN